MPKISYKKNDVYDGVASFDDVMYTEAQLIELKEEVYEYERSLGEKYKPYGSKYAYELGLFLSGKLKQYAIIDSERYKFWKMLRTYVNMKNKNIVITDIRDPYEYCYMLSKLPEDLVVKYSRTRWDYLFDCMTAREDKRIYTWLNSNNNEEFNKSSSFWQEFIKGLKVYFKNIDTSVYSDEDLYEKYNDIMKKAMYIVKYMGSTKRLKSTQRDNYFSKAKFVNYDENKLDEIIKDL
ncbi:MAG: hypothetical protein RR478_02710 [Bacilli bacterium]